MNFFLLLGVIGAVLVSMAQGVAAHGGILRVPWMLFLRSPKLVGGYRHIFINSLWLLLWVVFVAGSSGLIGFGTTYLRPTAAWAAERFGVTIANTPGASLFLITVGAALYFSLGTAHTCRRLSESPPRELIDSSGPNPAMSPSLAASYWRTQGVAALLAFLLTTVLVPFYQYFIDRKGVLEDGCVRLLLQEFSSHRLVRYCAARCIRRPATADEKAVHDELEQLLENAASQNDHMRAYAIAATLVRHHGFDGARSRIIQDDSRPPRSIERALTDSQGRILLAGVDWPCAVGDISKDGSGLGVKLRRTAADGYGSEWGPIATWVKAGAKVTAVLAGRRFDLVISRFSFNDEILTLGLSAPEPAQRRALLDSVRPRSSSPLYRLAQWLGLVH